MSLSFPTPHIAHLTEQDYERVYEPAEDSFALLDALEQDAESLRLRRPLICVEIGSGSGIVSAFVSSMMGADTALFLASDINIHAIGATKRTAEANAANIDLVLCNLLDPLLSRLKGMVDLLVFNPPYVETKESERRRCQSFRGIGGAWAGGCAGMSVTSELLEIVPALLAPTGHLYLVCVEQNQPREITRRLSTEGIHAHIVLKRRAGRELLSVVRASHITA